MLSGIWIEYRNRQAMVIALFVGFLPACLGAAMLSQAVFSNPFLVFAVAFFWMTAYLVAGYRLAKFHCPCCKQSFFYRGWMYNPWAKHCEHCNWEFGQEYNALKDASSVPDPERLACLSCGTLIPTDGDKCEQCGWSFKADES